MKLWFRSKSIYTNYKEYEKVCNDKKKKKTKIIIIHSMWKPIQLNKHLQIENICRWNKTYLEEEKKSKHTKKKSHILKCRTRSMKITLEISTKLLSDSFISPKWQIVNNQKLKNRDTQKVTIIKQSEIKIGNI